MVGPNTSLLDTCLPMEKRFYGYNDAVTADVVDGKWTIIQTSTQDKVCVLKGNGPNMDVDKGE